MRVCLSHEKEMAQIVILAAQISDNHPGRNSCKAHQSSKAGGVVFAKANPSMKEKLFQTVPSVLARRQRIAKSLLPEKLQRCIHYPAWMEFCVIQDCANSRTAGPID